ncbi:MAG: hypothetical protein AUK54_08585 [Helicobacteraceae bacterium CG2_30_36_10]|nr:MAG: hypothetical protein AUK54_08585 [Helicobacteraceae bacterium CG2_30_36_10]
MKHKLESKVKNMKISQKLVIVATAIAAFTMTGCNALQEGLASQMEVPTLENQANRVAIGMTIVRENNIMAFKMPISADAKWPAMVAKDINDTEKTFINNALMEGPYFSTVHYTKPIQRKMLGSGALMSQLGDYGNITSQLLDQTVSPLTYRAIQKITIFYGDKKQNWPNVFDYDGSLSNFLEFKDGKMQDIDSPTGDVYKTIGDAVISLAPVNMQKDLTLANEEMLQGFAEVAAVQATKGELETKLKVNMVKNNDKKEYAGFAPLTAEEKLDIEYEIAATETIIKEKESIANEKEAIYFELLDQAVIALESDINVDDENYVKLARNVNLVANEIQVSSTEAYTTFGLALGNIGANNVVLKFPTELESLVVAKAYIPLNLQSKYDERVARLVKNAVYLLPNIFIGTYYANKQSNLAEKYESVTKIILLAYEVKAEQEAEAKKAADEAAEAAAEESKLQ